MNTQVALAGQTAPAAVPRPTRVSLVARIAHRYGVDPDKLLATLKSTAFKVKGGEATNEQMMALLVVADEHGLNPFLREIYAFPDKSGGIVPVVGYDGWNRLMLSHPQFNGKEYTDGPAGNDGLPEWIECRVFRKDHEHPTAIREYMAECKRNTEPWSQWPRRMLRIKATIQAGRSAFGFVGFSDPDEAERIVDGSATIVMPDSPAIKDINAAVSGKGEPAQIEHDEIATDSAATDGQATADNASKPESTADEPDATAPTAEKPTLSYAAVRAQLDAALAAKSKDRLDEAAASISLVSSAPQRKELTALYKEYVARLAE